jgi:hypothetical protein
VHRHWWLAYDRKFVDFVTVFFYKIIASSTFINVLRVQWTKKVIIFTISVSVVVDLYKKTEDLSEEPIQWWDFFGVADGFYSVRRSRHHFRFKCRPGSPGMLGVDKFEIRGLRWLERFEWNRLYRVLATSWTVGIDRSLWSVSFET